MRHLKKDMRLVKQRQEKDIKSTPMTTNEPEMNRRIVLLFLEKFEILNERERAAVVKVIELLNTPMYIIEGKPVANGSFPFGSE